MTAVNISGTFSKDERPDNGLEDIAADLVKDEFSPRVIVGVVVPHAFKKKPGEPTTPVVKIRAIEVVDGDDATAVRALIDKARKAREQGPFEATLFDDGHDGGE